MRRMLAAAGVLVLALAPVARAQPGEEGPLSPPALESAAAILVDLDDGRVLYAKEVHTPLAPASLTKVVTALVVRDLFSLEEVVRVPPDVLAVRGGKLGMEPNMVFTVRDLLYALLIRSANDAGHVLASHDPAGYEHFIALMNQKARALGAFRSNFSNPHGMDEPGHVSTAWDLAILGRQLLADPVLAEIVAAPRHTMAWPDDAPRSFDNHNRLIATNPGAIGVKTGFTNQAGRCLMAAARLEEGNVLTVVLRAPDHYVETLALWNYFSASPPSLEAAQGGSGEGPLSLATPPPAPVTRSASGTVAAEAGVGSQGRDLRWVSLMALLGAVTLSTLQRRRRADPLVEAAGFHPYLEPLVGAPDAWESERRIMAGDSRRR